jgi:beta-galactosidase
MTGPNLPQFPYGAVYFRRSNPPQEDWERDYRTAAEDGMNCFRHWFLWSAIEVAPGKYEWSAYDRHLDLAAEHGLKTIIAEMLTVAPEWAYRRFASSLLEDREGRRRRSAMHPSCVSGGSPGLCLDHLDVGKAAEAFLRELAARYRDHPGLGGYDVWNECARAPCYCSATAVAFRKWLRRRYGELRTLCETWHRYSYTEWDDIVPPRHQGAYPDVLDWLQFNIEHAYEQMRWRVRIIRSVDSTHPITAHGVAGSLTSMAAAAADDWRAAAEADSYGYTWGSSRHGDEPWKQFHAVDLVRAACRGKPFWHAEAYGGPLWMAPQVVRKPRNEGRIAAPEDVRYWNLVSFMAGARGLFYLRWRPLLDGPLFGAFGPYGLDGSRTPRSEMSKRVGLWVCSQEQERLWRSNPVRGEIGILYVPETQIFAYAQQGDSKFYARSMQGAYQGFFDNNIQADWVHVEDMDGYKALYMPFPVMLSRATADKLRSWVEAGGVLICEGCPAYFGDHGRAGTVQPNYGLDELFGARECYVEFTPDLLADLRIRVGENTVRGGLFLQAYEARGGTPSGWYEDGRVAAVDHAFGRGRTRLVGTMCGAGYAEHPNDRHPGFFADLLRFAGIGQHVRCSEARVKARLQAGAGGTYLWVANPIREPLPVSLGLGDAWGPFARCRSLRGPVPTIEGNTVFLTAAARDVAVLELTK